MSEFIVLRAPRPPSLAEPFSRGLETFQFGGRALGPPQPQIDIEETDRKGVVDLKRDPEVHAIARPMPTRLIAPVETVEQKSEGDAWGISAIGADKSSFSGAGVVVGVLDTGIDKGHAAFQGVEVVEKDFSGNGTGDVQGHGTHCAGTVFGRDVNGTRIGVARGVSKALIGKVLADDGTGTSAMIFQGIQWVLGEGAHVISMSLGFDFPGMVKLMTDQGWPADLATSQALEAYRGNLRMFDALMSMCRAQEAFGPGAVVVAACGNESRREIDPDYEIAVSLPAASEGVVAVAALGRSEGRFVVAPFSNIFPNVSAPGVDIKSARAGGGLVEMSGTSMACPHVAGVAALWWEAVRGASLPTKASTVLSKLVGSTTVEGFGPGLDIPDRGSGLVRCP